MLTRYRKEVFYDEGGETLEQGCPEKVVGALSLEIFKVWLDRALRNRVWF